MSEIDQIKAVILSQKEIADGIYSTWLQADTVATAAKAGQFVNVSVKDKSKLLPRPISLCEINKEKGQIRLVYRVMGDGTRQLSEYEAGESLSIMGPLGNGFSLEGKHPVLVGGGIGIPPMLQLAKQFAARGVQPTVILGYRDTELYLYKEFEQCAKVYVSTDDGSVGTKGTVIDAIRANKLEPDVLYACGPTPMLRGVKVLGEGLDITAWISMEERMACGIGACLACVCKTKNMDAHSHVHNTRVCKEGPVFDAKEVELS